MSKTSPVKQSSIEEARNSISRIHIIAIAVSQYDDPKLRKLRGPLKDISIIEQLLFDPKLSIYENKKFEKLINPDVETARKKILEYCYRVSGRGDILVIYFSGHGTILGSGDFGFCMKDTKFPAFEESGVLPLSVLSFREVVQTLSVVDVHPVFVIDACFSAAAFPSLPKTLASMQFDLNSYASDAYGLLCSSNSESASNDYTDGGAFTKAIYTVAMEGIADDHQSLWPYITLRNIAKPLQSHLRRQGEPLSRLYIGSQLSHIPICKNVRYKRSKENFSPYMRKIIDLLWNNGNPIEVTSDDLRHRMPSAYGNHSKLSRKPWNLLEDGSKRGRKRSRRLTSKGVDFARGIESIPAAIVKDPESLEWISDPDSPNIYISDVSYTIELM